MIKKLKTYEDNFYLEMLKRFGRNGTRFKFSLVPSNIGL